MTQKNQYYNKWNTEDKENNENQYCKKVKNLEYIIRNKIITGNRFIDELEYDENEFFGRYYR